MKNRFVVIAAHVDHLEMRKAIIDLVERQGAEIVFTETPDFPPKKEMPKIEELIKIERFEPQRISVSFSSESKYFTKPKNNFKK